MKAAEAIPAGEERESSVQEIDFETWISEAQERIPSISVSSGAAPPADVGQSGQQYGYRDIGLGVSLPLIGGWDWNRASAPRFRLMVNVKFNTDSALLPYRPDRNNLINLDAGSRVFTC